MLFNSYEFIFLFLPITISVFWMGGKLFSNRFAIWWLAGMSLFFYGWWNYNYLWIILGSICWNYIFALLLNKCKQSYKKIVILSMGITGNIMILGYFKYSSFLLETIDSLFNVNYHVHQIILPLAISFFTFQQIAYLLDAYHDKSIEKEPINYLLFVCFFPQLIAGPIVHSREMLPQFKEEKFPKLKAEYLSVGLTLFFFGLFKKVIIADGIAQYATPVFQAAEAGQKVNFFSAWQGALSYTFQLYFDFSGYTDMALGLARMFGILLPMNFFSPYKATSIIDFWRRWHITLSRFLKECLYIPLGGSRAGSARQYLNLMITMALAGLWHGAGWTFVLWGTLHGLLLAVNHWFRNQMTLLNLQSRDPYLICLAIEYCKRITIFTLIVFLWVIFRADSLPAAYSILLSMVSFNESNQLSLITDMTPWKYIAALLFIVWFTPNTHEIMGNVKHCININKRIITDNIILRHLKWQPNLYWCACTLLCAVACILNLYSVSEFLYFNF